jgi:hypothetical protein
LRAHVSPLLPLPLISLLLATYAGLCSSHHPATGKINTGTHVHSVRCLAVGCFCSVCQRRCGGAPAPFCVCTVVGSPCFPTFGPTFGACLFTFYALAGFAVLAWGDFERGSGRASQGQWPTGHLPLAGTVRVFFDQRIALADGIGSHACWLEASMACDQWHSSRVLISDRLNCKFRPNPKGEGRTIEKLCIQLHGARFPTESYTRGCHWIPRMFA